MQWRPPYQCGTIIGRGQGQVQICVRQVVARFGTLRAIDAPTPARPHRSTPTTPEPWSPIPQTEGAGVRLVYRATGAARY